MGKFTAYKVELASKRDGHYEQDFHIGTEMFVNMENYDVQRADVSVHMEMEKRHDSYDIRFELRGVLEVPCDRCLDPLEIPIDTEYHVVVKYGDSYDDGADNLLVIPYSNSYLNVAYMLYDTLLLSIPLRHVHPMGKCNRAMAEALRKHRAGGEGEEEETESETSDTMIEE